MDGGTAIELANWNSYNSGASAWIIWVTWLQWMNELTSYVPLMMMGPEILTLKSSSTWVCFKFYFASSLKMIVAILKLSKIYWCLCNRFTSSYKKTVTDIRLDKALKWLRVICDSFEVCQLFRGFKQGFSEALFIICPFITRVIICKRIYRFC